MTIRYEKNCDIQIDQLQTLFLSVNWDSGNHPQKLAQAMASSHCVYTAWHKGRLVGLMSVISDGHMVAYIPYLVVQPEYQGQRIGSHLINLFRNDYKDVMNKVLVAYDTAVGFYERCGFGRGEDKSPMFITSLAL